MRFFETVVEGGCRGLQVEVKNGDLRDWKEVRGGGFQPGTTGASRRDLSGCAACLTKESSREARRGLGRSSFNADRAVAWPRRSVARVDKSIAEWRLWNGELRLRGGLYGLLAHPFRFHQFLENLRDRTAATTADRISPIPDFGKDCEIEFSAALICGLFLSRHGFE